MLNNISILCVDNYSDGLEVLKLSLQLNGARVYGAVSAAEAVRLFIEHRPDILISDLALPPDDGISLMNSIRSVAPLVPAIALTGISESAVREQAMKAGFDDYFVKPVDEAALCRSVSALASKGRKRSA